MAVASPLSPPAPIASRHDTAPFACARDELAVWLKRHALANEGRTARTYVAAEGTRVVGYYALAAGSVRREALPRALKHGTPEEIPVVVLGRLATDIAYEGRGIGRAMLREAIRRSLSAAEQIGVRALLVHAIDDRAVGFYRPFGFAPMALGPRTLILPIETAKRSIGDG